MPVKITVKFFDNIDPTLHILIASNKTQNKSTNVNTVGTQNAHHIAEGTLTKMSLSDFLGLVNGSEQFTKRMPDISRKTAKGQFPLLYTERLLEYAKRDGNIYTQRLLQRQIEKALKNSRSADTEASTPMPTIYADYMREHNMLEDYEDADSLNVYLENDANSDTMFAGAITDCFDRKVGIASAEEDLIEVNPNYAQKSYEWTNNCQRCVPAYEMRRRGFKVVAKPLPDMALHDYLANDYTLAWKNRQKIFCKSGNGLQQNKEQMTQWGNGARAEVYIQWNNKLLETTGHVFVAEQRNGRTVFLDPQNGEFDCERYFINAVNGMTNFLRIDNNTPSDYILDCCTNMR